MQLIDGRPVYSATDLVGYLACEHLTAMDRGVLEGRLGRPRRFEDDLEVLRARGRAHEQRYLAELAGEGKHVIEIHPDGSGTSYEPSVDDASVAETTEDGRSFGERLSMAACATEQAMADRWDVIYQGTFFDGHWRGHPDFLIRVDDPGRPSRFGAYHYEVADTKLARSAKAGAVLQVCSYVDYLERGQGIQSTRMHLVLGGSSRRTETLRTDEFMAYYRAVRDRFQSAMALPASVQFPPLTAPEPVEHCEVCRWKQRCDDQRRRVDHLSLVAGISSGQRRALGEQGILTLTALGQAPLDPPLAGMTRASGHRIREQARIQLEGRSSDVLLHERLLPIEPGKGLASLPPPSQGDLFLDMEGDPYALEDGLEYLFGVLEPGRTDEDGTPLFHAFWATDADLTMARTGEKRAFEDVVDLIMDRLAVDPDLHVYHYAPYEPTAFKKLMGRYGTREDEVDRLLRGGVLVDLYRAVRQGVRASVESYSIKKLEPLYGFTRDVGLRDATSSIVEFERWLALPSAERPSADHLDRILAYNRDDVVSAWRLRGWLENQRALLVESGTEVPRPGRPDDAPPESLQEVLDRVAAVAARLTDGVPVDPDERSPDQHARWLLAQLLSWHRREEKSTWWLYYHLMSDLTDQERIEAREPLGGLEYVGVIRDVAKSSIHRYRFPHQEHDLKVGATVHDPATGKPTGTVDAIDEAERVLDLKRGRGSEIPHPSSVVPLDHVNTDVLRDSLLRLGDWVVEHGIDGDGAHLASRALLRRSPPRLPESAESAPGPVLQHAGESGLHAALRLSPLLDHSVLPIQGPPGSGKTHVGAQMITALLREGRIVGITANSHKVIGNLLSRVCETAADAGVVVRAVQKAEPDEAYVDSSVVCATTNVGVVQALADGSANLVCGTAWLWARPEMADKVDVLFVDEAGQFCLANALAVAQAARSMVLLGDPLQLDQPVKGVHPPGVAVSALAHLLGDVATMPPERGLFLEETWRLHPDLCRFTSRAFYEGKLTTEAQLGAQRVISSAFRPSGTGPRLVQVRHTGNDNESPEEAWCIASLAGQLVESGATWIDRDGVEKPVGWDDILIVAAYNGQVDLIRQLLPPDARVGTVDKFQGQEAPISFYSMASSSAQDAPRGMTFLYNAHRLNVATSRARCVAVIVCSPELIRVRARTVQEMRLANALCQFVECVPAD